MIAVQPEEVHMRKPRNIARYSLGPALAALTTVTILALVHVGPAQAQTAAPKGNGKIAFRDFRYDGQYRSGISVMNPDGSGRAELTATQILCPQPNRPPGSCGPDQLDNSPSWSPDGKQIAFIRNVPVPGYNDVYVMNADGSNQRRLTQIGSVSSPFRPTWSPDGTKLAFVGPPVGDYYSQIYVMNVDGSNQRPIGRGVDPEWSPEGSKLAFSFGGLYLMNPDGSNRTQITAPKNPSAGLSDYDSEPAWSPDGMRILFIRSVGCDLDEDCESITLWTVNADGSNPAKLADIATDGLAWSPDGTKIVFRWLDGNFRDLFTMESDGSNVTRLTNTPDEYDSMPSWQSVALNIPPGVNPLDDAQFFVRQHYQDFLNREPDADGLAFWTNEITSCGNDQQCIDVKRINVSAAYFLSIEFQQTGYLVYRFYKASYGNALDAPVPVRLNEFLPDTKEIGQGLVVNQSGWEQLLESNKQTFATEFVQRSRFVSAYPTSMSSEQFVDALFANAGVTPSASERTAAINEFSFGATTNDVAARTRALRRVAENSTLAQQEFNRAFVLMQYFGYLRRNPNDAPDANFAGYTFWLNKLDSFNGDFAQAEMVKAFINSAEYRQRFGP
jgi:hypothetical protein